MKESFYFPHDTNASQDEKIICLLKDHGLEGLAVYWIMVEVLHQQESGKMRLEAFDSTVQMYVSAFGKDKERSFNVRSTFVQRGLFKVVEGYITNDRILRNKAHRQKLSNAGKIGAQASVNKRLRTTVQANKGKERKIKEIINTPLPPKGGSIFDFECLWMKYPKRLGKKDAQRHFNATVKTEGDYKDINIALGNYLQSDQVTKGEFQYIKHGSTWFNNWKDYLDITVATGKSKELLELEAMVHGQRT